MSQEAIWDHFQNEGADAFVGADARTEFIVRRLKPGERVLNIGVGVGGLERAATAKGVEMWSLDPGERAIARLREQLGMGDRAQAGFSQQMPFPDGHFDTVVMSEVLEHLEGDVLPDTVREVFRVLKPGGRFIGTVPARENLADNEVVCPNCAHHFHRWGHHRTFDIAALRATLAGSFDVRVAEEHFFIEWDSVGWKRRLGGLVKQLLSARNIGTYGTARSIYFDALKRK